VRGRCDGASVRRVAWVCSGRCCPSVASRIAPIKRGMVQEESSVTGGRVYPSRSWVSEEQRARRGLGRAQKERNRAKTGRGIGQMKMGDMTYLN